MDVPERANKGVIRLLEDLDVREDSWKASPKRYASFLREWLDSDAHQMHRRLTSRYGTAS